MAGISDLSYFQWVTWPQTLSTWWHQLDSSLSPLFFMLGKISEIRIGQNIGDSMNTWSGFFKEMFLNWIRSSSLIFHSSLRKMACEIMTPFYDVINMSYILPLDVVPEEDGKTSFMEAYLVENIFTFYNWPLTYDPWLLFQWISTSIHRKFSCCIVKHIPYVLTSYHITYCMKKDNNN